MCMYVCMYICVLYRGLVYSLLVTVIIMIVIGIVIGGSEGFTFSLFTVVFAGLVYSYLHLTSNEFSQTLLSPTFFPVHIYHKDSGSLTQRNLPGVILIAMFMLIIWWGIIEQFWVCMCIFVYIYLSYPIITTYNNTYNYLPNNQ